MTNNIPQFGDDIPGLNLLPDQLRIWFLVLLVLSPYITRAFYALRSGGGLKGIFTSIWLGTNTPKEDIEPDGEPLIKNKP